MSDDVYAYIDIPGVGMKRVLVTSFGDDVSDYGSLNDCYVTLNSGKRALITLNVSSGGEIRASRIITSDDIFTNADYAILIDASLNTVDLSFPADPNHGQIFNAYCIDSTFAAAVLGNGNNINGSASSKALLATESITAQFDSTYDWFIS